MLHNKSYTVAETLTYIGGDLGTLSKAIVDHDEGAHGNPSENRISKVLTPPNPK